MRSVLAAIAFALLAGCGGDDTADIPDEGTIFEASRAGGIAFSIYEIEIDADGTGTASFGSNPQSLEEEEFELTPAQLDELRTTLEENPIPDLPEPNGQCADCFAYTYAWGGDEVTFDETSSPEELDPVRELIADLPLPEDQANGG